ncbi:tetratricopeptide repeat protein [Anatilimnocola floriformis]|uniref:tetratricopeptide repeat protein n=1 Tax=Anatilimnocola floriformis TaxID=2948575 RepID=UPI0020C56A3F|nr:hypothetical protein [Anatilimnocola floriformis]
MHWRTRLWGVLVSLLLLTPTVAQENPPAEKPAFPSLEAAVKALGDDEFSVRQRASAYVWKVGNPALPLLEQAVKSTDPEVRLRGNLILRNLRLGITPDSPIELQIMVSQFYDGDRNARLRVINDLRQKGAFTTLFGLLKLETDAASKQLYFNSLQADIQRLAPQMIAANDWSILEQCFELGKSTDVGRSQYVAFLSLRDQLPAELKKAEAEFAKNPADANAAILLAAMLRARGNGAQALQVATAAKTPTQLFVQGLAREQKSWEQLLGTYSTKSDVPRAELYRLGMRASCYRLLGKKEQAEETLQAVFAAAPGDDIWYAAKIALLNDRPADALKLLTDSGLRPMAFELLVQQQRHDEALKLVGVTDETEFDAAWLSSLSGDKAVRTSRTVDRFSFAVTIAAELRLLGKQKQYAALREFLETTASVDDSRGAYWLALARLERAPGRQKEHLKILSRAAAPNLAAVMSAAFTGKRLQKAQLWWETLNADGRWQEMDDHLFGVAVALMPKTFERFVTADWPAIAKQAKTLANDPANTAAQRGRLHVLLAEAWAARDNRADAETHFEAAILADPASAEAYGDWLFTGERWSDAAAQYGRAVAANQGNPLTWFLQGTSLIRSGDEAAGRKLLQTANLMCLDSPSRYQLAFALQERGLRDEAREQWQLLQKTGNPEDQYVTITNQHLGNIIAEKEPLAAADHWEQLRFHVLKPTTNLTEQSGYLDIAHSLHRTRARGLISKEDRSPADTEAAFALLALCEQLQPGEIKLVEEFFPLLNKQGLTKEADKVFEDCFALYHSQTKQYPDSANIHNQAAWVAAICARRLDEALVLSERAVKLAPENPSYTDTLAEVHFARGNRELALEWARKAAALDPGSKFYEDRLQAFAKREFPQR